MRELKIVSKLGIVAAIAAPLALSGPVAFAADECVTADEHETANGHVADYAAQRAAAQDALTLATSRLADAETALTDVRSQAESVAAQVRDANARKNAALAEIATREGYISGFQAKLPTWEAKRETALDLIGKAQRDYRTAKNAGDQAGMDAAHAAAEAARVDKSAAEAQIEHYGPASQQNQRNRIAKLQTTVDEMTALGKSLYPTYQALQRQIPELAIARDVAADAVAARQRDVVDAGALLADAEANAALPVCEPEPAPEPTPEPAPVPEVPAVVQPSAPSEQASARRPVGSAAPVATRTADAPASTGPAAAPAFTAKPLTSPVTVVPSAGSVAASPLTAPTPVGTPDVTMQLASAPTGTSSSLLWTGIAVGAVVAVGAVGGGVAYARKQ